MAVNFINAAHKALEAYTLTNGLQDKVFYSYAANGAEIDNRTELDITVPVSAALKERCTDVFSLWSSAIDGYYGVSLFCSDFDVVCSNEDGKWGCGCANGDVSLCRYIADGVEGGMCIDCD